MPSALPNGGLEVWPILIDPWAGGVGYDRIGPAQHPFGPNIHMTGHGLEDGAGVAAGGHQIPEIDIAATTAGRVVKVGQTKVMTVFVTKTPTPASSGCIM